MLFFLRKTKSTARGPYKFRTKMNSAYFGRMQLYLCFWVSRYPIPDQNFNDNAAAIFVSALLSALS